jgi:hypothetical protein
MTTLIPYTQKAILFETAQVIPFKFALGLMQKGDAEIKQYTPWFYCKEYLTDEFYCIQYPKNVTNVFGWEPVLHTLEPALDKIYLLIKYPASTQCREAGALYNTILSRLHLSSLQVFFKKISYDPETFCYIAYTKIPLKLSLSPAAFSLFISLLRLSFLPLAEETFECVKNVHRNMPTNDSKILNDLPDKYLENVLRFAASNYTLDYGSATTKLSLFHYSCGISTAYQLYINNNGNHSPSFINGNLYAYLDTNGYK